MDNLLFRKSIPWRYVSGIRAGNGLLILTSGGEKISSLMYGDLSSVRSQETGKHVRW